MVHRLRIDAGLLQRMGITMKKTVPTDFSRCCKKEQRYIQTLEGGLVKKLCMGCFNTTKLSNEEFFRVGKWLNPVCPICSESMIPEIENRSKNYVLKCAKCNHFIWFSDLTKVNMTGTAPAFQYAGAIRPA